MAERIIKSPDIYSLEVVSSGLSAHNISPLGNAFYRILGTLGGTNTSPSVFEILWNLLGVAVLVWQEPEEMKICFMLLRA